MHKLILAALVLCANATAAFAADAPPTPDSLIAAARQATGGPAWDKIVTWHENGTLAAGGLSGTYDSWTDLPTLRNRGSFALGPASGGGGWDGRQVWTTDSSKEVRIEASEEAVAQAIQDAYRASYAFYFPGRFPAAQAYAGTRQAGGKTFDAVKITPQGADPFEIWFDRTTHRIDREVQLTGGQPHTFIVSDYAKFGDILEPRNMIDRVANDPKFDTVLHVSSIVLGPPELAGRYAPPPPPANTAQWPAGQDSVTLPFQLINNHIYVDVSVNGHAPIPFVFDTGATNDIAAATAKSLGIAVKGALPMGGVGEKVEGVGLAKVKSVSLGGFTLTDQVFFADNSPAWVLIEGAPSEGLVGYEFVKHAVLTIDYAKGTLTFTKQAAFHPPAGVTAIPFTFAEHVPMLPGALDGIPGEFMLDTGSRGALLLMGPFAQANGLAAKYHATVSGTIGYGVGGPARALLARAGKLTLGPVTIPAPVTEILLNKSGVGADTHTAGNVGGDLLKRFTVTLDYANRLVWLQPNELADQPEVFDRSGLWIMRARDGAIEIADVTTQSAAAKLGLVTGDEITSVNGKPAKDTTLYDLREALKGATGTAFTLAIKSKTGPKNVTLVLADQV